MKCPHCNKEIKPASVMAHQRANKLSKKRRSDIARNAVKTRWNKRVI